MFECSETVSEDNIRIRRLPRRLPTFDLTNLAFPPVHIMLPCFSHSLVAGETPTCILQDRPRTVREMRNTRCLGRTEVPRFSSDFMFEFWCLTSLTTCSALPDHAVQVRRHCRPRVNAVWGRQRIMDDALSTPPCCIDFSIASRGGHLSRENMVQVGEWSQPVAELLWSLYDVMDICTTSTEELHATQQTHVCNNPGTGYVYSTFAAKCVNRLASSLHGSSVRRSLYAASQPVTSAGLAGRTPDGRGGIQTVKSLLRSEVARERDAPVT